MKGFWIFFLQTRVCALMVPIAPMTSFSRVPHKMQVLGKNLVLWKKKCGSVACLEDRCAHRFAQLSRGIVTREDKIKCGYHGIEYDSNGQATLLPHSVSNKCSGIKCEAKYTKSEFELTWVNMSLNNFTTHDYSLYESRVFNTPWFSCQSAVPFKLLLENSIDLLHPENTHHGILGIDRFRIFRKYDTNANFTTVYYNRSGFKLNIMDKIIIEYMAPFHTRLDFHGVFGGKFSILTFVIPKNAFESNYMSRVIYTHPSIKKNGFLSRLANFFLDILASQENSERIFDQDINQINGQLENSNKFQEYGHYTAGDKPIIMIDRWFKDFLNS